MREKYSSAVIALYAMLVPALATAQFAVAYEPSPPPIESQMSSERLREEWKTCRWRLGALRLAPAVFVRDVQYLRNVYGTRPPYVSDVTASAGVGLYGYLPLGAHGMLAAKAEPVYTWWRDLTERRVWNGHYGAAATWEKGRLALLAMANLRQEPRVPSADLIQPINTKEGSVLGEVEFRLTPQVATVVRHEEREVQYRRRDVPDLASELDRLERNQRLQALGWRWRPGKRVTLGAGLSRAEVRFPDAENDLSASGNGWFVEGRFEGTRWTANATFFKHRLKPEGHSLFLPYSRTSWGFQIGSREYQKLQWRLYGHRRIAFLARVLGYHVDEGYGATVGLRLREQILAAVLFEEGSFDGIGAPDGSKDLVGWQVDWQPRGRAWRLGVRGSREWRELGGEKLEVERFSVSLGLGANRGRW